MIEAMRGRLVSWVVKILAGLLILSFAIWGIGDMFYAVQPQTRAASVGGFEISRTQLSNEFNRVVRQMQARLGPSFGNEQAVSLGLLDQTLDRLVDARLLSLEGARLGLTAGEPLIRDMIFKNPEFHNALGKFDPLVFQQALAGRSMNEAVYVATLRDDIVRNQIAGAITAGARPPKLLADTLYRYRNEKRTADVVVVPFGPISNISDPDDAELARFHKENAGMFTAPAFRRITLLYLNPDEAAKEIKVSDAQLREEFEARKSALTVPEERTVEQLLFQDADKAKAAVAKIRAGTAFADAAKAAGVAVVSLGSVVQRDLPPEVGTVAFKLKKDAVSDPVQTALGWHVLRATRIKPGKTPDFDAVKGRIRFQIARERAIDNLIQLTGKIEDALAGGGSLADAGAAVGIEPREIAAIAADGTGADGKPITGLPPGDEFLRNVFSVPVGESSNVVESENGGYFVVQVHQTIAPALRPLSAVRDRAVKAWKLRRLQDVAEEKARHLTERAKATTLADAAGKAGYKVASSKPFSRFIRDPNSPVSDELSAALFKAKPAEFASARTGDGIGVAQLTKVIEAKPGENPAEAKALNAQLETAVDNDALAQLLGALRKRFPVEINRAAIDIIAGSGSSY